MTRGRWIMDGSIPTIDDVAKLAGVSISTVSRVINGTVPVSEGALRRVEAAMRDLQYVPRAAARNLASRRTHTLGLLLSEIRGDFFGPLLMGIEDVAHAEGYDLLISTAGRRGSHVELPGWLGRHNTDGLLVFAGALKEAGLVQASVLPMVLIHESPPPALSIPCVTIENKNAARAIVEHLITVHGRRRIALLQGPADNEDAYWREMGYREALDQYNLPFDPALVAPGNFDREAAQASVAQLLADRVDFDAIFTSDDEAAVGALRALQEVGRRVPEEAAVVGFDDQRLAAVLNPPLTTVYAPTEEVGRVAARELFCLMRTGEAEPLTLLPTELVIRRSCGCG